MVHLEMVLRAAHFYANAVAHVRLHPEKAPQAGKAEKAPRWKGREGRWTDPTYAPSLATTG